MADSEINEDNWYNFTLNVGWKDYLNMHSVNRKCTYECDRGMTDEWVQ